MVLAYAGKKQLMLEMLGKGRELANELEKELTAVIVGDENHALAEEYIQYGADKVFLIRTNQEMFKAEEYTQILTGLIEESESELVLIGSNKDGKELAPRLAAKLKAGCVSECTDIHIDDGDIITERTIFSGKAVAKEKINSKQGIITVPSKTFDPLDADTGRNGDIIEKEIMVDPSRSKIIDVKEMEHSGVNVEDAEVIVSCGRGFDNREDIELAENLAAQFKGRAIGCSRPISADLNWLPEEHWVGLSGHKVKPRVYFAVGISGQIQHIAGMRDSDIIVAINKDPDALIFDNADYGIVGDLYKVLPELIDAIENAKT